MALGYCLCNFEKSGLIVGNKVYNGDAICKCNDMVTGETVSAVVYM